MILSAGRQTTKSLKKRQAFTLIELLVVIALAAIMMGLTISFVGNTSKTKLKSAARSLVGTIRYAYNEAATKNLYFRIAFDVSEEKYWVESSAESFILKNSSQEAKEEKKINSKSEDTQTESSPAFSQVDNGLIKRVDLAAGVTFKDIFVSHQEVPVTEGLAYLYFFPQGLTEKAIIHLSDEEGETVYSITVNPLTGRSQVTLGSGEI